MSGYVLEWGSGFKCVYESRHALTDEYLFVSVAMGYNIIACWCTFDCNVYNRTTNGFGAKTVKFKNASMIAFRKRSFVI
jgi:hypothetical protein